MKNAHWIVDNANDHFQLYTSFWTWEEFKPSLLVQSTSSLPNKHTSFLLSLSKKRIAYLFLLKDATFSTHFSFSQLPWLTAVSHPSPPPLSNFVLPVWTKANHTFDYSAGWYGWKMYLDIGISYQSVLIIIDWFGLLPIWNKDQDKNSHIKKSIFFASVTHIRDFPETLKMTNAFFLPKSDPDFFSKWY